MNGQIGTIIVPDVKMRINIVVSEKFLQDLGGLQFAFVFCGIGVY